MEGDALAGSLCTHAVGIRDRRAVGNHRRNFKSAVTTVFKSVATTVFKSADSADLPRHHVELAGD
jgi:hypothetical protein